MLWYKLSDRKPIAYKTGAWDGKKSDKILVATINETIHVVEMYEGVIDGFEYCEFYDSHDWEVNNVVFWAELDSPF